ncbi:MAG: deoxyribodipyrimidine photolyase, partial [Candidatus Poseidoniaceae archaeon]
MNSNISDRVRLVNDKPINEDGEFILYWMIATRRYNYNASLQLAAELAQEHDLPLLVIEEISTSHKFANDRIATFMIQGMVENIATFRDNNIRYIPWVETPLSGPIGLLKEIAKRAKIIVSDEFPTYYPRRAIEAASESIPIQMYTADSNGVIPMSWTDSAHTTAHGFRRWIHANFTRCPETWP